MKKLFFILTTILFFTSSALCDDDCSSIQIKPEIKITSSYGKLIFDTSKSKEDLTSMTKQHVFVENGIFANGLSVADINFDISLTTVIQKLNDSSFCVFPKNVTVFLGLNNPTIYVSKSLKEGTCEYNVVMKHEKTHQQINKKTLEFYLPLFKNTATTIIENTKFLSATNEKDAEKISSTFAKIYSEKLTPLVDFIKKEIFKQQQKLDNPDNYKYENSLCL